MRQCQIIECQWLLSVCGREIVIVGYESCISLDRKSQMEDVNMLCQSEIRWEIDS